MTYETIIIKQRAIARMNYLTDVKNKVDEVCWLAAEKIYEEWGSYKELILTPDILQVFGRIGELHPQAKVTSEVAMIENLMRQTISKAQRTGAYALRDYVNHVYRAYTRSNESPFEIAHSRYAPVLFKK